jgi:hypothetical protein
VGYSFLKNERNRLTVTDNSGRFAANGKDEEFKKENMITQQIRNAMVKIIYGGITFLVYPWFRIREAASQAKLSNRKCRESNVR